MKILINSFNAGEITPLLWGRVDLENLRRACRKLRNFIPRVFGGAFRRPSLMHVAMTQTPASHARLIPFGVSASARYMVELSHLYYRIFDVATRAVVHSGVAPWTADQLDGIHYVQVNDIMWLTHPDVEPRELIRESTYWVMVPIQWGTRNAYPPMLDENLTSTTLSCSETSGEGRVLNASADLFTTDHLGSWWQVGHFREAPTVEISVDPPAKQGVTSAQVTLSEQTYKIRSQGNWSGTLVIKRYNTTDKDFDTVEQFENILGAQVAASFRVGALTGDNLKHTLEISNLVVHPGPNFSAEVTLADGTLVSGLQITATAPTPATAQSQELRVNGNWELYTYGRWSGSVFLEEKNVAGGWDIIRRWTGNYDRNISASGTVDGEVTMRVRVANASGAAASDAAKPRFILEASKSIVFGLVKVVSYTSPTQVTVDIYRNLWSTSPTIHWSEGAWSKVRGYPRALALHEQRLVFAATRHQRQSIWGSVTGDFRNFEQTNLDDGSISYQIAAQESHPIVWLASQDGLIIGTEGDEWLMDGDGKPLTPSNVRVKRQSSEGSAAIQAKLVGSVVLFVQRGGLSLREYLFQWETQNYAAPFVTQLVGHMTVSGIRDFSFSKNPERLLWVVTNDGRLLSCTYRREEQVIAWAQHPTDGTVEAVACVFGEEASGDEVWLIVNRTGTRRIERLNAEHWQDLETGSMLSHLDAAVVKKDQFPSPAFSTVSGLSHLEGRTVSIVADGAEQAQAVVQSGAVAVPLGTTHAVVGLPAPCSISPMHFEVPLQDGTAQGRKFRVTELAAGFYRSQAASYKDGDNGSLYNVSFRSIEDDQDEAPPPFSGMKRLPMMAEHRDTVEIEISTESALSLNVQSLVPSVGVYGS